MPYGSAYQILINPTGTTDTVTILIYDKTSFNPDPLWATELIPLNDDKGRTPEGSLKIKTVDNNENKFSPIKAKEATVSFFSTNQLNLNNFADGEDDRWIVVISLAGLVLFDGFLVLADLSENYQPYPNIVTLTATDNIALLKDTPLTDANNLNPKGKYTIAQYIAMCLAKTNLSLNLMVVNNICEQSAPGVSFYNTCFVDAKTFESSIGVSEDCYTVLSKILGDDSFLTQWRGQWWIIRVDEMADNPFIVHGFNSLGVYAGIQETSSYFQDINSAQPITLINDDANITLERPYKKITETYNYETAQEIVDNIDFSRGGFFAGPVVDMSLFILAFANTGAFPATGDSTKTYKANDTGNFYKWNGSSYTLITLAEAPIGAAYHADDWTFSRLPVGSTLLTTGYIVRIFESGYEKSRYLDIPGTASGGHYFSSNQIPVGPKSKFNFSIDRRLSQNAGGSGSTTDFFAQIRLLGDDGTFWSLTNIASGSEQPGDWVQSNSGFTINNRFITDIWDKGAVDETEWRTGSVTGRPVPVSGVIQIYLLQSAVFFGSETHFANISFDYTPFINGSYAKYSGHTNNVSQTGNYKAAHDQQVYLGDSPDRLYKGALLKFVSGKYILAGLFYNAAVFPGTSLPDISFLHPFGFIQAFSVWNQYRRVFRLFDVTMLNLRTSTGQITIPDLAHVYRIQDSTPHTLNKNFMLMHIEQDFDNNQLSGRLAEIWDVTKPKQYSDLFEFKYISATK